MPLTPGTRLGPYEVVAPIGAGGMGEVYRARDTRLNRVVAIKSLLAAMAGDPERIARFEREAQLLASLNHPNIAAIHGLQEMEATAGQPAATYLVLEFVDGKPLDAILRESGAMALGDALPIARQIADAISAAHEKGIVHRDLKPGNVMVTGEGQVKVLDFGLGKSIGNEDGSAVSQANSPTITVGATQAGIILGTAAYMSPEQAKGKPVDKRSDVWSFGCVLYEMLTGRRAFQGEDVSDTLASVLKESPDWNRLPGDLPPAVRLVVERCLAKDRGLRFAELSTVRFLLTEPGAISSSIVEPVLEAQRVAVGTKRSFTLVWAFGMVVGLLAGVAGALWLRGSAPAAGATSSGAMHVSIRLPAGTAVESSNQALAISPDGRHVVYVTTSAKPKLYVRDLASPEAHELAGTEGAGYPFFSPNGQWVGFVAQDKLKKASIGGGAVDTLATVGDVRGAAWGEDGYIYFPLSNVSSLSRVPESGGTPVEVTRLDVAAGEISHRDPQMLPDGKTILFTIWKGPGPDEKFVAVQPLAGGPHRILIRGGADGYYVPPGYLAYARGDRLFAVPFDLTALDVAKTAPVQMDQRIIGEATERAAFAVSPTGMLAYLPATPSRLERRLVWQDASGTIQPLPLPNRAYEMVRLSPDGASAIVQIIDGAVGLWRLDLAQGTLTPLVTSGGSSQAAAWTPDGRRIIYRATRNGVRNLYWKSADGTGEEERLTTKPGMMHTPSSVSPDGQWALFSETGPQSERGLYRLHLSGSKEIVQVSGAPGESNSQISPNGKWLAMEGLPGPEIYVRAFADAGPRIQVSRNGGTQPAWSPDGTKLYFERERQLWVADVAAGTTFSAGAPRLLIDKGLLLSPNGVTGFSVARDGRILRVEQAGPEPPSDTINLVLNWTAELARMIK